MTIELGFAELTLGTTRFGIVDVPGHERFVRTMVAGATGIDIGLLVVAADDSVMPQTIEHVEILKLLDVRNVVVAITKIDTVDEEMVALVVDEVERLVADTLGVDCPVHRVSSTTGTGVEALKSSLVNVANAPTATAAKRQVARGSEIYANADDSLCITALQSIRTRLLACVSPNSAEMFLHHIHMCEAGQL